MQTLQELLLVSEGFICISARNYNGSNRLTVKKEKIKKSVSLDWPVRNVAVSPHSGPSVPQGFPRLCALGRKLLGDGKGNRLREGPD